MKAQMMSLFESVPGMAADDLPLFTGRPANFRSANFEEPELEPSWEQEILEETDPFCLPAFTYYFHDETQYT